jgi:hypothetical protein
VELLFAAMALCTAKMVARKMKRCTEFLLAMCFLLTLFARAVMIWLDGDASFTDSLVRVSVTVIEATRASSGDTSGETARRAKSEN